MAKAPQTEEPTIETVEDPIVAQGALAQAEGLKPEDCPYGTGDLADRWRAGFVAAEA